MTETNLRQSRMTNAVWAKYDKMTDGWYPLWAHLEDTAAVARRLYPLWLSDSQQRLLANIFGAPERAKKVAIWLAGCHDVGKATAAFAMKVEPLRARMEDAGFEFPRRPPPPAEQRAYPHGRAGQIAVARYLEKHAAGLRSRQSLHRLAEIVGGHHGQFPADEPVPSAFGTNEHPCWWSAREDLLQRADQLAGLDDEEWKQVLAAQITEPTQALLTGFLIVCDWIASDVSLFPFDPQRDADTQAFEALASLDFGDHWDTSGLGDIDQYFKKRFAITQLRPVQRDAVDAARSVSEPSLCLIEAPTGEGKTEIALAAAEDMASKFGLHGLMIALPTRATSDAMFTRTLKWLRNSGQEEHSVTVNLAHGKAQFDEEMRSLPRSHDFRTIYGDEPEPTLVAHEWFTGRKKSIFADFVVGTVDQLLFGALKAKHLTLRHLGLSSKVVVIDEIHAADTFMQTYLHRVLEWLGAYGVPVVALSATLPPAQRSALLSAYRRGAKVAEQAIRSTGTEERSRIRRANREDDEQIAEYANNHAYPLITVVGSSQGVQLSPVRSDRRTSYEISEVSDDKLIGRVLEEARKGGCIAVVLDTVNRAQTIFGELSHAKSNGQFTGEVQLLHSRFTAESRSVKEKQLVHRLGRDADDRPDSLIVVATQVIEASLDVDFDMMFTDFAPIDLLIQRMGRVHRHTRPDDQRPSTMHVARIVLSGGEAILQDDQIPQFQKGVSRVYGNSLLYRSALALRNLFSGRGSNSIVIPGDVPDLIRATYANDPLVPEPWLTEFQNAEQERLAHEADQSRRSKTFAIGGPGRGHIAEWSRLAANEASEDAGAAQVRDAELSLEVAVVQRRNGRIYPLPWLPEQYVEQQVDLREINAPLARQVAMCTVALPSWLTMGPNLDRVIDDLERCGIEGWQTSYWLRGVLPLVLDEDFRATLGAHVVRYDRNLGLLIEGKVGQ